MISVEQLDSAIHQWFGSAAPNGEAIFRLMLAVVGGGLTGLEREYHGREAGFRTNILVCVGAALAMIVSYHVSLLDVAPIGRVTITADPGRIAYGVMAGIGFLGAGAIVRTGTSIRGLTTAANIWCMAALGLTFGLGLYVVGVVSLALILLVLLLFQRLEHLFPKVRRRRIVVRRKWAPACLDETIARFTSSRYRITEITIDHSKHEDTVDFAVSLAFPNRQNYVQLERDLLADTEYELITATED
jgi:putative Mg2+ transporter-C (MgtC) family protein